MMLNDWKKSLKIKQQLGLSVMYRAPGIIERVGQDWDWIWIDSQHGLLDYHDILNMVRVCNAMDLPVIVRSESHDSGIIGKYLDMHIDGLMLPMINTAEQAVKMVQAAKFYPRGERSYGGRRPIDMMGRKYAHDHDPLLICQIETKEGVKNAGEIAAVDGVDAIFFGADDLALREGIVMDQKLAADVLEENLKKVASAAKANNKIAGGVFASSPSVKQAVSLGFTLLVSSGDAFLLSQASKSTTQILRETIEGNTSVSDDESKSLY